MRVSRERAEMDGADIITRSNVLEAQEFAPRESAF